MAIRKGFVMREYTVSEIAEIVGGELIAGDGGIKITEFSTDSRVGDAATMFVPVIGEHVDAHDFIKDAGAHGMRATFTCRREVAESLKADDMAVVYIDIPGEKNPNVEALQRFGAHVRGNFGIPVVGVTGSVGKTTTKEMVAMALSTGFCTLKTEGNMNSQVGLPRMMCRLSDKHEMAVIEMGMSMPGEMARIVRVARPECAVITNIGVSHIEQLGTYENILREKLNIINEFPDGGVLFVNGDDDLLREVADAWKEVCAEGENEYEEEDGGVLVHGVLMDVATAKRFPHIRIVTYVTKAGCDYRSRIAGPSDGGMDFRFSCPQRQGNLTVHLAVTGKHNVQNALAALSVAAHYGIDPERAAEGLLKYQAGEMRGRKIEVGGKILIDDTYNACPDSMMGGIDGLMMIKAKRHIAVLGDMLELGDISSVCHSMLGDYLVRQRVDYVVAVGRDAKFYLGRASRENGPVVSLSNARPGARMVRMSYGMEGSYFEDNASALAFLKDFLKEGDAVLFKGSRGMKLEELVEGLM